MKKVMFIILSLPFYCYADLPLSLDELFTDKGKVKFEASLTYSNSDSKAFTSGDPIIIETGDGFIAIPTALGEKVINSDTAVGTLGLRYGLTARIEPYIRGSYLSNHQRIAEHTGYQYRASRNNWHDAVLGLHYKLPSKSDVVEFLGYAETSIYARYREHTVNFKNYAVGLTGYYSIDPIVLSLTLSYQFALSRHLSGIHYQPSHYFTLNPTLGFAVNDKITLLGGLQWVFRSAEKVSSIKQGLNQTQTAFQFGMGYGLTHNSTLSINANMKASGQPSTDIRISFSHTFN